MANNHNEPVTLRDAYHYAYDLIDDNVFEKDDLLKKLDNLKSKNPEKIYEWLAEQAISRHNQCFDEDDIAVDIFYNDKPVLFFDDIYEEYVKTENKKYKIFGSAIVALAVLAGVTHALIDEKLTTSDASIYIINLNLIVAGSIIAYKYRKY